MKLFPRILKFGYYFTIVSAFCANMMVVSHTTALSVLGAGLALRGPDGSMMTATDGLYEERKFVFLIFGVGLACTVGSVVICVWIILQWESALICMVMTLLTCRTIWRNYRRVQQRFDFDENDTVDFRDIMEGPAAIQVMPMIKSALHRAKNAAIDATSLTSTNSSKKDSYYRMKKSKSLPEDATFDTDESSESEWVKGSQRLLDRKWDTNMKRRGRSSSPPENFIQTV